MKKDEEHQKPDNHGTRWIQHIVLNGERDHDESAANTHGPHAAADEGMLSLAKLDIGESSPAEKSILT